MYFLQTLSGRKRLREQFRAFSQFGDRNSDGKTITLSRYVLEKSFFRSAYHISDLSLIMHRSDKWLKQAGIVDEDFITTTDTAILFRKMSRFGIEFCTELNLE